MNTIFSVDDLDSLWQSPALPPELPSPVAAGSVRTMNRSASEWALERFIQETAGSPLSASSVADGASGGPAVDPSGVSQAPSTKLEEGDEDVVEIRKPPPFHPSPTPPIDSEEYSAFLRESLHRACAAVAMSRASAPKPYGSTSSAEKESHASPTSKLGSQAAEPGDCFSIEQDKADGGSLGVPTLSAVQRKSGVQGGPTTSDSSREQSDDDDPEGDAETIENLNPADDKRARRMQSNRESARRSRRRKQEHLNDLEKQVGEMRVENSSLSNRLTDVNQKYRDAAVDNRVLRADIETLRAKVKMAEESVKRVTGFNPLLQSVPEMPNVGVPFVNRPSNVPTDASVPVQLDANQFLNQPVPNITAAPHDQRLNNVFPGNPPVNNLQNDVAGNNMGRTSSMQRPASLEHVQKRICVGASLRGAMPGCDAETSLAGLDGNK